MIKKLTLLCAGTVFACVTVFAQTAVNVNLPPTPSTPAAQTPVALNADRVENIYSSAGAITSIEFVTDKKIESIKIGSPIAEIKYNAERKILDIFPKIREGKTNMNVVVEGTTYVFLLSVVENDKRLEFRRTFTFADEELNPDSAVMSKAPHIKPGDIDVVGATNQIEQARIDATFRAKLPFYRMRPINKIYQWNGNMIHLLEAHQFADKDLVVLKVQWINEGRKAYYIKDSQYEVWLVNKQIPVTARMQATNGTVFPGQLETVWLFVQGYRLSLNNDWSIKLPPEASSVRQLLN